MTSGGVSGEAFWGGMPRITVCLGASFSTVWRMSASSCVSGTPAMRLFVPIMMSATSTSSTVGVLAAITVLVAPSVPQPPAKVSGSPTT